MPLRRHGTVPWANHVLILARLGGNRLQGFGDGFSGNGQGIAVQLAMRQQHFHHLRNAAGGVQFGDHVFAGRLQIAKDRNPPAYRFEILERQRHVRCARDRQQMQHGVGRAAAWP